MQYRRLGRSGLQLSELSLGSWVTYHNQVDVSAAKEMLAAALDAGINFFDNAEVYANGQSETIMGEAFKQLGRSSLDYVVSTKFFWGLERGKPGQRPRINGQDTLNRKYLHHAIDQSLERMQRECIDLAFCHRPDPHTPIEETVWAPLHNMAFLREGLTDPAKNAAVGKLTAIADELGGSVAQLAIAWINRNPRVSTVILGASKLAQLHDNIKALELTPKLTPDVLARIDAVTLPLAT